MQVTPTPHHAHHHVGHSLFLLGSFLLILVVTLLSPASTYKTDAFGVSDLITLSNESRIQLNKRPLAANSQLMNAAQMKAEDMAKGQYFAHTAPDGTVAWDYFKKVSYSYEAAGENLAITNQNAQSVIDGWLNSPAHRDNLLADGYTDFGIGMAFFGNYDNHADTYVIVALYGRVAAVQALGAPTYPSGTSTALKPKLATINPAYLIALGSVLVIAGAGLEFRHIRRLHHHKQIAI